MTSSAARCVRPSSFSTGTRSDCRTVDGAGATGADGSAGASTVVPPSAGRSGAVASPLSIRHSADTSGGSPKPRASCSTRTDSASMVLKSTSKAVASSRRTSCCAATNTSSR